LAAEPVATVRIDGARRALIASDMHLGAHAPELTARFLAALDDAVPGVTELFLLGDLFEAWIGDDSTDQAAEELAAALARLASDGMRIRVIRGNRDFLLGRQPDPAIVESYPQRAGFELCEEPVILEAFGRRVVLCHGDALCTDDIEYQRFRTSSREAAWQDAFLARPVAERERLARAYRDASEASKQAKDEYLMDVNPAAVDQLLDRMSADCIVHGHTHRPALHRWRRGDRQRERWVLPDWTMSPRRGGFLRIDAQGWTRLGDW
jgi:UDP-2,3-diacylglucosamine hydrolase